MYDILSMSACSKERDILCTSAMSLSFEHISTQNICICSTQKLNGCMGVYMCVCAGVCVRACVCSCVRVCVYTPTIIHTPPELYVCATYVLYAHLY